MSDERRATSIALHIDELVLHGFAGADRHAVAAALERALQRLFAERGVPTGLASHSGAARLDGGSFAVAPGGDTEAIGAQLAEAIYGGLQR